MKIKRTKLTPKMILYAQWKSNPYRDPSTELAFSKTIDVTEKTLSNWKKEEIFKEYFEGLIDEAVKEPYPEIVKNLGERAKGDRRDAKIYLDHIDKLENRKKGVIGEGSVTIIVHGEK